MQEFLNRLLLLLALATLASCELLQTRPPPPKEPEPAVVAPQPPVVNPRQAEIDRLLDEAALALDDYRLLTPPENNAYSRYLRVLNLDPGNMTARVGIGDIIERYLNWALQEAQARRFSRARAYVESALSIDPSHPNIAAVQRQIEELENARTTRYKLPPAGLQRRSPDVVALLQRIGLDLADRDASVVITARSDAEGRWIYQQLNELSGKRVRAELQIGTPPSVELFILPETSTH